MAEKSSPRVFISYTHDSDDHKKRVLALADRLRADGIDSRIDRYISVPEEGWPRWMVNQVRAADFVLVVCTQTYVRRFDGTDPPGQGKGGKWEGAVITQELYNGESWNTKFVPVLFAHDAAQWIPVSLQGTNYYVPITRDGYFDLYRRLTGQHGTPPPDLGALKEMRPMRRRGLFDENPQ